MKRIFCLLFLSPFFVHCIDQALLKKFEEYAVEQQHLWQVPGMSVAIVKDQEVVLARGYGQRGLNDKRKVDANTIFQIGSLSKAFTSALVAKAVDEGQINWQDKVRDHFPEFRMADAWVTAKFQIIDLLCQRSGLPAYAGDTQVFLGDNQQAILDHLYLIKPESSFRSEYAYQNVFFNLAAEVLKKKYGQEYSVQLKKELFDPLKMNSSSVSLEDYLKSENRAEWLIRKKDGSTVVLDQNYAYRNWNYIYAPAGGINSNVNDMAQWLLLQSNQGTIGKNRLISKENMQKMARPMIFASEAMGHDLFYALGWVSMTHSPYPIVWHDGSTLGVYNVAAFIPEEKLGIVVLTNVRNTKLAAGLAFDFIELYYGRDPHWSKEFLDKSKEVQKSENEIQNPLPPQPLENYVGVYTSPIYGEFQVKLEEGSLVLVMREHLPKLVLKHFNRDAFRTSFEPVEEEPVKVVFWINFSGQVSHMEIDFIVKEGGGVFTKLESQ